jgi:diguanylate cyclase (GGDEF)-like protein
MYRVRDLMSSRALYVTPEATIEAAMDLLRLQQLELLPVVQDGAVVGLLDSLTLYRYHGELPVREIMLPPITIEADAPLGQAAALMLQHHLRQLPVLDQGRLAGLLSHRDLLATWGASADAVTGLPWQDHMRRWAAGHLASGREIAVLFIDLNDFGAFNKAHGHVQGDRALKAIAAAMKSAVDPRRDMLCRYGGDEFAVATTRSQEEAWLLGRELQEVVSQTVLEPEELTVGVSIGLAGGKRRAPRPGEHAPATLDDLINWASRASTRAKTDPGRLVAFEGTGPDGPEFRTLPTSAERAAPAEGSPRVGVDDYHIISHGEPGVQATVALRRGHQLYRASATHAGGERLHAVALATVACLQSLIIDEASLSLEEVRVLPSADEGGGESRPSHPSMPAIVAASLTLTLPHHVERLLGAVHLQEDRYRSVINAVLDAVNRRLGVLCRSDTAPPSRSERARRSRPAHPSLPELRAEDPETPEAEAETEGDEGHNALRSPAPVFPSPVKEESPSSLPAHD